MKTYPLTQPQLGIYLSEMSAEGQGDYNINLVYYLDSAVDTERLVRALEHTVDCHPYIKSRLCQSESDDVILQDCSDEQVEVRVEHVDSEAAVLQSVGRPFDLLHERLYRLVIYLLPDGTRMLNIDFHHIVCDGMSTRLFHEQVGKAYDNLEDGKPERCGFEEAEAVVAQRSSADYAAAKDWYTQTFSAGADVDSMPLPDIPNSADEPSRWVTEFIPVPVNKEALSRCCEHNGVGISFPFTAAFGYLLANYTAEEQVVFATIYHGRSKEQSGAMGMFVKTLPVLMNFSGLDVSCAEQIKKLSDQIRQARRHTIYSFAELTNDLSLRPRVCFAYQANLHMYHLVLDGKEQRDLFVRKHRPGLDMIVNLIEVDGDYQIKIEYNTSSYSSDFIHEFCVSYANILNGMLTHEYLRDVEITSPEQQRLLDTFNPQPVAQATPATIVSLFDEMVQRYPDRPAVIYQETQLTYRELDERATQMAACIGAALPADLSSQPVVAILIGRSEQMVVCALAALKAGAAYQPLDPSYPQDRLNFMVQDSHAQVLLCDNSLRTLITDFDGAVIDVVDDLPAPSVTPIHPLTPDSTFILLYTSGSTGTPKGVVLQHHNLVTFCHWYRRFYHLTPDSRVLAYASFGFDADMMDLYPALTTGAAVVIAPEAMRLDLDILSQYMADKGVTHSFMTTQVGYQFACNFDTHPTLQYLSVGGEKLASLNPPTGYRLFNAYGPTECTIFSTIHPVIHNEPNIPIGRPLETIQAQVVNRFGKRLPWGASGELVMYGDQVGHGYLNQPDKTAAAFVTVGTERAYRTGDIVRYRHNGDIAFVGRTDGQIKIRGFRIELKEVESAIRPFPGISDCTVQAFDMQGGGKYLAAYIVSPQTIDIEALKTFIAAHKPAYMVPSVIMQIDSIPLNVNQKVDKKKLPEPTITPTASSTGPRTMNILEKQLSEMLQSLTGQEAGIDEPMTYYGLNSILAMRLSVMLYKRFGIKVAGKDLLGTTSLIDVENQ